MYLSSLSLFRVLLKEYYVFSFLVSVVFSLFSTMIFWVQGFGCVCMRMQLACIRKLVKYKYAYAHNWYAHAYSSQKSLIPFLFFFSFVLFACFSLYFNLASVSLSLFLSVLFQFSCFISLMLIRVLDCLNTMNMHINMNMH